MSKDYDKRNDDKDLSRTRITPNETSLTNENISRRGNETPDTGGSVVPTPKHTTTMGSPVTGDSSADISGPQDGSFISPVGRGALSGLPAEAIANPGPRKPDNEPMGGLGGRAESRAGEKESDQQQIGGTSIDNQGDNPALR